MPSNGTGLNRLLVQLLLPILRDAPFRAGHRLANGVVGWGSQRRAGDKLFAAVVIKPVFARLKAGDNGVFRLVGVFCGVLRGRVIAASNMAALCAAPEVEPPASSGFTFNATGTARWGRSFDGLIGHISLLSERPHTEAGCNLSVEPGVNDTRVSSARPSPEPGPSEQVVVDLASKGWHLPGHIG